MSDVGRISMKACPVLDARARQVSTNEKLQSTCRIHSLGVGGLDPLKLVKVNSPANVS